MSVSTEGRHAAAGEEHPGPVAARIAWATFLVIALVSIVSAVYLRPYLEQPARLPHGVDTPGYIHRSRTVYELGLNALTSYGDRPAHPIVTSVLRDVTGGAPLDLARAWPAIFAVVIGLAGAALGSGVAAERNWASAALGVGLAASPFIALTAIGYASNVMLNIFAVAAVAVAVHIRSGRRGVAALILLLGAAAIAHWLFAILLVALLAVYAVGVTLVTWLRNPPDGHPAGGRWRDPRRLLVAVGLGTLLGTVLVLTSPELPRKVPSPRRHDSASKIATRLPAMALGVTIPLAAAGGVVMWVARRPPTRRTLPPLAMWAFAAPIGLVAWKAFDMTIPHRTVPFALGIPFLIVLGAGATRWLAQDRVPARRRWVQAGAVVSGVLVISSAAWLAVRGAEAWTNRAPVGVTPAQLAQATTLTAYLETIPPGTPIVVPISPGVWRPIRALMITLPVERYADVKPWRVNFFGDRARFRERLAAKFPDGAIAAYLADYSNQPALGGTRLGPGVHLLAGPRPGTEQTARPPTPGPASELIRITLTSIATLLIVGLGWAILLTGLPAFAAVGIAPAIGTAMLALGGFVAGRPGFPLGRGGGVIVALVIGVSGWIATFLMSRRSAPAIEPEPDGASTAPIVARESGRHLAGDGGVRSE